MKVLRSDCCEQPVYTKWEGDKFKTHVTNWHVCIKCGEPCNVIEIEVEDWKENK